jgi:hypothetical protein
MFEVQIVTNNKEIPMYLYIISRGSIINTSKLLLHSNYLNIYSSVKQFSRILL